MHSYDIYYLVGMFIVTLLLLLVYKSNKQNQNVNRNKKICDPQY